MTTDDRTMESALAGLGVAAPASLAPNVLADVGLADRYARFDSPIGPLVVAWNGLGVSAVEAADDDATFEANHLARTGRPAHPVERVPDRLAAAIARRLEGDRRVRIDLDLRGHTDFERDVWQKALEIPAARSGPTAGSPPDRPPKAVRAVGTALGTTPCHSSFRAIGSSARTARSASTRSAGRRTSGRSSRPRASTCRRWNGSRRPASGSSARTRPRSSACRPAGTPAG